jgi:mitogen-activated protein kinase kinase
MPVQVKSDSAPQATAQPVSRDFAPGAGADAGAASGATLIPTGSALAGPGGIPAGFKMPNGAPTLKNTLSAPAVPSAKKPSLAEKRGLVLPGGLPGSPQPNGSGPVAGAKPKKKGPGLSLSQITGEQPNKDGSSAGGSAIDKYSQFLDKKTGTLRFAGKAVLSSHGVEFASGSSFSISLDEVDTLDELGKGNYGTVYKVRHSRPKIRRPGLGLAGNKLRHNEQPSSPTRRSAEFKEQSSPTAPKVTGGTTGIIMAMKEMRLELDDAKFASIVMELDILHKCISPYIVDFYGAFFQEGAVYVCMEYMDGGSIDNIYGNGVPEAVLKKITYSTVQGLRTLKDDHNIIHRDVKPTNILINTKGEVKICDFGVSGNLVASFAKTNIGCQSYMAPERISTGSMDVVSNPGGGTYSVQSDIWSLGLTIIESALGRYPYPPETYNNIFSQLSVSRYSCLLQAQANLISRPSSTATRPISRKKASQTQPAISSTAASIRSPNSAPPTQCSSNTLGLHL